jgi:NAD(P)-dependent dehydrogenase (short-subunit alcohol dehydrogenase family)
MTTVSDSVWFITGTSTGLGRAFAEHAIKKNYRVVATALDIEEVKDFAEICPARVMIAKLDVTNADDMTASVKAAVERFGRIDVLINNAGYALIGPVEETTEELLRDQMNVNFFGSMAVSRAVLPYMRAQKSGSIVQISSMCGSVAIPGFGAYSASKFALEGMCEALQAEIAPFGIRVLIVKPGAFRTAISSGSGPVTISTGVYDDTPVGQSKHLLRAMRNT